MSYEESKNELAEKGWAASDDDAKRLAQWDPFAAEAERNATAGLGYMQELQNSAPMFATAGEREDAAQTFSAGRRKVTSAAAQRGLLSSASFDNMLREGAQQEAVASAALVAREEQGRRAQQLQASSVLGQASTAVRQLPTEMDVTYVGGDSITSRAKKTTSVFDPERQTITDAQTEASRILNDLNTRRPSYQQMGQTLAREVNNSFNVQANKMMEMAKQRGMSGEYVQGLKARLETDRKSALTQADRFARDVTGADPQIAAATLQALYSPDRIEAIQQERINPLWGLAGGVVGAIVGGVAGGGPGGAAAGYGVGSGLGAGAGYLFG